MIKSNDLVKEYILKYCSNEHTPEFAIMISGEWGCGKTWFIEEEIIKVLENQHRKIIYISLYGISSKSEIDEEIFRELHPILSDKRMKLAGRILKEFVKGSLKIDLYGDLKPDANIDFQIPDLELPKHLKETDKHILIFDDLERCSIPINELLGYLNYFVEHGKHKLIVVSNEQELYFRNDEEGGEKKFSYHRVKEKLIGKTFKIEPDIDQALSKFFDQSIHNNSSPLLQFKDVIKQVYINSNYKNLRHLRQAILDFCEIVELLEKPYKNNEELLKELLIEFLALTFETRSGAIKTSEIRDISKNMSIIKFGQKTDIEAARFQELERKYIEFNWGGDLLPNEIWSEIFSTGYYDKDKINSSLGNSKYSIEEKTPNWRLLWNFYNLDDGQLKKLIESVEKDLQSAKFDNASTLKHVVGILLALIELKIYKKTKEYVIKIAKSNARSLKKANKLFDTKKADLSIDKTGANGLGFHSMNDICFQNFINYLENLTEQARVQNYPKEAKILINYISTEPNKFFQQLIVNNDVDSPYSDVPILTFISPTYFVEKFLEASAQSYRAVNICFRERYKVGNDVLEKLSSEKDWLIKTSSTLKKRSKKFKGTIRAVQMDLLATTMSESASKLNLQ